MNFKIYTKIMTDKDFRKKFITDPAAVLKEQGITNYDGKHILVYENTPRVLHFALMPEGTDLEELNVPEKYQTIQKKAWQDKNYLQKLLNDPKDIMAEFFGSISDQIRIVFLAWAAETVHIILPAFPGQADELSDDDLEIVAGGKGGDDEFFRTIIKPVMPIQSKAKDGLDDSIRFSKKVFSGW